jgi:hypothetical protein
VRSDQRAILATCGLAMLVLANASAASILPPTWTTWTTTAVALACVAAAAACLVAAVRGVRPRHGRTR